MKTVSSFADYTKNYSAFQCGTTAPIRKVTEEPSRTPKPLKREIDAPMPLDPTKTPIKPTIPSKEPVPVGEE